MEKIKLRKLRMSDIDEVIKGIKNDNVLKNLNMDLTEKTLTRNFEIKWLKKRLQNYKTKKPRNYALAITLDGKIIGVVSLQNIDFYNNTTEFGYWIAEPHWGKGYASTAISEFIKQMTKKYGFVRWQAYVNDYNIASQKVLIKNGFKLECTRKKAVRKGSSHINDKQYALILR